MSEFPVLPFVDGTLIASQDKATVDVVDPSTGRRLMSIPGGCVRDVDAAVTSARRTFEGASWSESSPKLRAKALQYWADLIAEEARFLDAMDAGEMGKPIGELRFNASAAAEHVRFYAEAIDKVTGDVLMSDRESLVVQRLVPRGVVAAVVPWNFPTYVTVLKLAPSLAAGNCVVLKPSEVSSRSALRLAQLAIKAGIPPGVLNVVPGRGEIVGRALGLHCGVDMMTFTGSTEVGKLMLQYASQSNMKVVMAECGGKSAHIVFNDGVDVAGAGRWIANSLILNQGQLCSVGSRVLVDRSIEKALLEEVVASLKQVSVGNALDPNTTFGPLASDKQYERVLRYIDAGRLDGAKLVAGGRRLLPETGGYFVEPTVFSGVSPDDRIAQEEIFGPVLSVIPFDDESQAIRIANGTRYGLSAYVWTADLSRGMRLAKAIRSTVFINSAPPMGDGPGHAFSSEPAGESGVGVEGGLAGLKSFLRRQLVWISHV